MPIVGLQKLSPMEFFIDSHSNYSKKQHIGKQQWINTPQWETQATDFFYLKYYNFNLDIIIDNSQVPEMLPLLFLTHFSFKCSLPPFLDPLPFVFCLSSPFYSFNPCFYHYSCLVTCQSLKDIFLNFIGFLPTFILQL